MAQIRLDFGSMIAGKTHFEIMSMNKCKRYRWYKIILPEEKEEAIKMMKDVRRIKLSVATSGKNNPMYGKKHSEESKTKNSIAHIGENNSAKRPEVRNKISVAKIEYWKELENRTRMLGENNPSKRLDIRIKLSIIMVEQWKDLEYRAKMSKAWMGENNPNWKDGSSFEPYCSLFNNEKREEIRNKYGRTCVICGRSTLQNMSEDKTYWLGRLDVDHVDENKMQGCNDWEWRLAPLCHFCHGKMQNRQLHLLFQLLLINNKSEQINLI